MRVNTTPTGACTNLMRALFRKQEMVEEPAVGSTADAHFFGAVTVANSPDNPSYIDVNELIARTGMSRATVWRLKRDGKIPFFQPAGKGGRVTFPEDVVERVVECATPALVEGHGDLAERLPGPPPAWMASPNG